VIPRVEVVVDPDAHRAVHRVPGIYAAATQPTCLNSPPGVTGTAHRSGGEHDGTLHTLPWWLSPTSPRSSRTSMRAGQGGGGYAASATGSGAWLKQGCQRRKSSTNWSLRTHTLFVTLRHSGNGGRSNRDSRLADGQSRQLVFEPEPGRQSGGGRGAVAGRVLLPATRE
jgi:hypothetical protein